MRFPIVIPAFAALIAHGGEFKLESLVLDKFTEGDPPPEIFVIAGDFQVKNRDGHKVLVIAGTRPEIDAAAVFGPSANGTVMIQARVFATKAGRSFPRFGVGVHGQTGFRLFVVPARKELHLMNNDDVEKKVPFDWKSGSRVILRLEVVAAGKDKWTAKGKAWSADDTEPLDFQITHPFSGSAPRGQCSIWGTPYAGTPIDFDALKVGLEN